MGRLIGEVLPPNRTRISQRPKVAHLTTVDLSLRYLVLPQLLAVREIGGEALGISSPGRYVPELEALGVRHVPLRSSSRAMDPIADLRAARELWRILRRERPDVLHTHNPKPGLYGRVLGRLAGVPVVVNTVHGLYATPDDAWPKRALVYGLEAIASRFSDLELVQNVEDEALLRRWRITRPTRTRLLGNGVDLARFDPSRFPAAERDRIRREIGAEKETIVVGMVGRLVAEKGYPELFEMARRLDERFLVVCVGPDDADKSDALPRHVIDAATEAGVRFLGMRSDVDRLYAAMDLFVLPSHREGFPRAAMEAAAMGLPVIATNIRGCRQVVEDGENGLLFPVGDVDRLTAHVEALGADAVRRQRMARSAIERAAERFDERHVVRIVMDSYAQVAARKGLLWPDLSPGPSNVRRATVADAPRVARLHVEGIQTGFLSTLGDRFLRVLYRSLIAWEKATVLVADTGRVVGFAAGVVDTGEFYRHFLRRHGVLAAVLAAPRLLRPTALRRAWETLRYAADTGTPAELLSMAVAPSARGQGTGRKLGGDLLQALAADAPVVKVVVGSDNVPAIALYKGLGFEPVGRLEVHSSEKSMEMVWSSPA